jgi:DNA-binding CsgD family transcriptional regulator
VKSDAISIVEAAYDCESDTRAWFTRLLDQAGPMLDQGFGICASTYVPGTTPDEAWVESRGMSESVGKSLQEMSAAYPDIFHEVNRSAPPASVGTRLLRLSPKEARAWPPYVTHMHPLGIHELAGLVARDPSGHSIVFSIPLPGVRRLSRRESSTWSRTAAHISAGARVRRVIENLSNDDLAEGADAVLSPSGSMLHGEGDAQSPDSRESLRHAAKAIDRARSKARSNEDEALDLWLGLVAGRWSLIEKFDSDGRRFMVARRNDPQVTDPRALGIRERQVLAYVAMGHPAKLIAYSLGVSPSSVSTTRRTAMRKLGLKTTADVVRLFAGPPGPEGPQER